MKVYTVYLSKNKTKSKLFSNEFLKSVAKEVESIAKKHKKASSALYEIKRHLKNKCTSGEFAPNQGFIIDFAHERVILYEANHATQEYDEVRLSLIEYNGSYFITRMKDTIKKIENNALYIVESNFDEDGLLYPVFKNLKESNHKKKIKLKGEEVKKLLNNWLEFVYSIDKESPGFILGWEVNVVPICSLDPFAVAGNKWEFNGNKKSIEIKCKYVIQCGEVYRQFLEAIQFCLVQNKKENPL